MPDCLSSKSALQVTQQGVKILFDWLEITLPDSWLLDRSSDRKIQIAVAEAKELLNWSKYPQILQYNTSLISDRKNPKIYNWQPKIIENYQPTIPYPQIEKPTAVAIKKFKEKTNQELKQLRLKAADWQNLSFLSMLIEKYGSFISLGTEDIALSDLVVATAALAVVLTEQPKSLSIIAGNLWGDRQFITHIGYDRELTSLEARSFYLKLVKQEIVCQLLDVLKLPHTNLIYSGNNVFYILAPTTEINQNKIAQIRQKLNQDLLREFQGKIFLALDSQECPIKDINSDKFAECWLIINRKLAVIREQKFSECNQVNQLLQPQIVYEPCELCHRDDVAILQPLKQDQKNSLSVCPTCARLFALGGKLHQVKAIVRSPKENMPGALEWISCLATNYHFFADYSEIDLDALSVNETLFLLNDWQLEHYRQRQIIPLRWETSKVKRQLAKKTDLSSAKELSETTNEVEKVGYLTMRVDNWRQIVVNKIKEQPALPRLINLSRQIDYFFKVYLPSLAENRDQNLADNCQTIALVNNHYSNIALIYAEHEYLLVAGVWKEVIQFCFDIYQCFCAYTGFSPQLTMSAGMSLTNSQFSIYQAVKDSQAATEEAHKNGGDSLSLFGEVFKWDEWLGNQNYRQENPQIQQYLQTEHKPEIWGIIPFVQQIQEQLDYRACRYFSSNLLATAQLQEQQLKEAKNKSDSDRQAIRYFLNLPKIAYTIAQLPIEIRAHPDFAVVRTSLKNPWNARYFRAIATFLNLVNRP